MTRQPVTLTSSDNVERCAAIMGREHVGAILVKDGDTVKGIITEQDIVRKLVAHGENPTTCKLADVMESALVTIRPGEDIFEALKIMRDKNIRHLPVVDEGAFLGLVTMKDILKLQPQLFDILLEKMEIREGDRKLGIEPHPLD